MDVDSVTIDVTGTRDTVGNAQQDYAPEREYGIDTQNPVVTAVTVTQASGSPQVTRWAYDGDGERFREDAPGGGVTLYAGELQELQVAGGQVLTRTGAVTVRKS